MSLCLTFAKLFSGVGILVFVAVDLGVSMLNSYCSLSLTAFIHYFLELCQTWGECWIPYRVYLNKIVLRITNLTLAPYHTNFFTYKKRPMTGSLKAPGSSSNIHLLSRYVPQWLNVGSAYLYLRHILTRCWSKRIKVLSWNIFHNAAWRVQLT